ncbi:hypothetical protein CY35_06G006200 [Sphagnum magellanicum]|nr:hypothetical protein CY35_06G006200 [Sphagnum magellanicum]
MQPELGHCQGGDLEDKEVHRSSSQVYPGSPSARGSGAARMWDGKSTNGRIWKMSQQTLIHAAFGSHWDVDLEATLNTLVGAAF